MNDSNITKDEGQVMCMSCRYMMVHQSELGRSVKEILRLTQAFR